MLDNAIPKHKCPDLRWKLQKTNSSAFLDNYSCNCQPELDLEGTDEGEKSLLKFPDYTLTQLNINCFQ